MEKEKVLEALGRGKGDILSRPNVVGIGVGYKEKGGLETSELSVVVLVEKKLPREVLSVQALVPERIAAVRTDVIEVGRLRALGRPEKAKTTPHLEGAAQAPLLTSPATKQALPVASGEATQAQTMMLAASAKTLAFSPAPATQAPPLSPLAATQATSMVVNQDGAPSFTLATTKDRTILPLAEKVPSQHRNRLRPAHPGGSIGHHRITAGTFGAVVYYGRRGEPVILSNNHVLANATNGHDGRARRGDPILQPGPYDGGRPEDAIARLLKYVPVYTYRGDRLPLAAAAGPAGWNEETYHLAGLGGSSTPAFVADHSEGTSYPMGAADPSAYAFGDEGRVAGGTLLFSPASPSGDALRPSANNLGQGEEVGSALSSRPLLRQNLVDAAIARPLGPDLIDPTILEIGEVTGVAAATLRQEVLKSGRTTGLTRGRVRTLHATVQVEYGEGRVAIFTEQVVTTAMSQGGDSGSLILDRDGRAVGLLFAGSDQATIFSPIGAVERLLGVRVAGKALTAGTR